MTSFLPLKVLCSDFERNSAEMNNVCICCTSQNVVTIKFSFCEHTRFLTNYIKSEIDLKNTYICKICHEMLKIIEVFTQQVEGSISLLLKQATIHKPHSVTIVGEPTDIDVATNSEIVITAIKSEATEEECLQVEEVETDIKLEQESSENETERISELKKECSEDDSDVIVLHDSPDYYVEPELKKMINEYEGKIRIVMLTEKQLQEERKRLAKNEVYMRLLYKCEDCIVGFNHESSLINHNEITHMKIEDGFECKVCKASFSDRAAYQNHTNIHFRRMDCMICQKRFKDMSYAVLHYNKFHAPAGTVITRTYTCKECGYTTTKARTFRYHKEKHKQKQSCSICGNLYVTKYAVKVHMNLVHKERQEYKCEQCDKIYRSKSGIENHRRTAHTTSDMQAYCVACKTYFRTENGLKHHLSTHSKHINENDKKFICDECGARFVAKRTLQDHISWEHFRINTHPCTKCDKVYRNRHALDRHVMYVHKKQRPPRNKICDYCGRAFTSQQILKSHIRTHTGERPLHCSHCPATFAHSAALYNHNRLLHTNK